MKSYEVVQLCAAAGLSGQDTLDLMAEARQWEAMWRRVSDALLPPTEDKQEQGQRGDE